MHRVCLIFGCLIIGLVIYDMVRRRKVQEYYEDFFKKWDGCGKTFLARCVDLSPHCREDECNTEVEKKNCKKTCRLCQDAPNSQEINDCIIDYVQLNGSYINDANLIFENRIKMYMAKTPDAKAVGQSVHKTHTKFI